MSLLIRYFLPVFIFSALHAQEIPKENLTKIDKTYWDYNKSKVQSEGRYFKDKLGETVEKHGKWTYYDKYGAIEEYRNYHRDMLHGEVVLFYPNGKKRQQGYFTLNRQDSVYTEWYETGHLKVEGSYQLDQPVGEWKYYYRDGRLISVEEIEGDQNLVLSFFLPDEKHTQLITNGIGELVTYYTTGQVKEWYNYEAGLKNGPCEEYSIYGYPLLKGFFKDAEKDSTWTYYYYKGAIEKVCSYRNDMLDGAYTYYFEDGKVNIEGNYSKGLKQGEWIWYTKKETKDMQGNFVDDAQDGKWTYWYPTGEVSYYANYDKGIKTGSWTYYYKNGEKHKEGTFSNDLKNGKWQTWYEDGVLLMEGDFLNDKEHGLWHNYWPDGTLKNQANFKNGVLDGEWFSYFPNGKMSLSGKYKDDMKVGSWSEYFSNGKPKDVITYKIVKKKSKMDYGLMKDHIVHESIRDGESLSYSSKDYKPTEKGNYKDGEKDGEWIAYYPGGKVPAVVSNYKNGKLDGTMKQFSKRGNLLQEMDYKGGLKHGRFIIYDKKGKIIEERRFEYGMQVIEGSINTPGSFTPGK